MNTFERRDFDSIRPVLASGAFFVFIFTFQFYSCPTLLIGIWVVAFGVAVGFVVFSCCSVLPSFLLHWGPRKRNNEDLDQQQTVVSGTCTICGNRKCQRHRPEISRAKLKPWEDLLIPESVDSALQEFLSLLLQNYIYNWYRELSCSETCIDEIRTSIRYMAAVLIKRIRKIDIPTLVTENLGKEGLKHLEMYLRAKEKVTLSRSTSLQTAILEQFNPRMHCALQSRPMELQYLRKLSESILPFLLPPNALRCRSLVSLLRELLASAVFLSAADKLSDPDFVNNFLLILLDKEPMVASDEPPSPKVPLLAKFAKPRVPLTNSALHLSIADILHSQSALFPFMQFMKSEGALNILQFCLTVEDFNKRIFTPEITKEEEVLLIKEVKEIFRSYFDTAAVDRINFDAEIVKELKSCISGNVDTMERLKMATLLSRAYEYAYNLLETTFLPLFYQSDDYFSLLCGSRLPAKPLYKPASRVSKKKFDPLAEFSRLAGKLKDKMMNPTKDDSPYEEDAFDIPDTPPDFDLESEEEMELEEKEARDLSMWKITIPHVIMETKQKGIFIISVERRDITEATRWDVARRPKEFYVLQSKLNEFHGEIDDSLLPPNRNTSRSITQKTTAVYFEACRVQFERYLQYLCSNPLLRGSALLFNFLSPDKEFSNMFVPEKVGDKAGKKIKSMTTILKKEKGQNLDSFLQAFLSSTVEPTKRKPLPKGILEQSQRRSEEGHYLLRRKSSGYSRLKAEERKGSCGNVVVQRGRNKPGFHRDLSTYVEWTVSGSSHSDLQDCQLLLVEYFPSGVYVDPDHIKNEEEFGGPEVLITEAINTEVMAHHSSPHKVFLFPKAVVNSRLGCIYVNISIPIHLRYHKAAKKEKFVPVSLSPPTILGKCNHGMDNFATRCASEMIKAPCSARKSSRYCDWITLTQVNEENLLVFQVPVGQTEHTLLITILTVFSAIAGSSLLVWNSSLSSC